MKKILSMCVLSFASLVAVSAEIKPNAQMTPEEKKKILEEVRLRYYGGDLLRPNTKKGEIVYVDCQALAGRDLIEASVKYFQEETKFNITIKNGKFDLLNPKIEGDLTLFIVNDERMPSILSAPENRWAMVNVAPLVKGRGEKEAFFKARVGKQLTRGFSLLCGAINSSYPNALTGGIRNPDDLDRHVDARLPVDVIARFQPYMEPFGVTPAVITTYRRACQEGWAPAPTNEYQKAIWNKVHALPTAPITIKPETKKVDK